MAKNLPAVLIAACLALTAWKPGFPTALVFLSSLLFYVKNAGNYTSLETVAEAHEEMEEDLEAATQRLNDLEKKLEPLDEIKVVVQQLRNRPAFK